MQRGISIQWMGYIALQLGLYHRAIDAVLPLYEEKKYSGMVGHSDEDANTDPCCIYITLLAIHIVYSTCAYLCCHWSIDASIMHWKIKSCCKPCDAFISFFPGG
jgi:hypothetical protein